MLPTFIIGLREGVEAALIVGIIATFLRQEGRRDAMRSMWFGVGAAIAICVAVGVGLELLNQDLPQRQQEMLETVVGAAAVGIVTFMVVWMRRHSRNLSGALRASAGAALAQGSAAALVGMAFFAVIREGLETVVFLLAVFQNAQDPVAGGIGAILGLVCAVVIGMLIYRGGIRLNYSRFFRITGALLVLVAAGLVASTIHTAHEAGWLNAGQSTAMDLSWLVVPGTWTSSLLTGMLGWQPSPTRAEVIGYFLYLVPMMLYVLWPANLGKRLRSPGVRATGLGVVVVAIAALSLGACGSSGSGSDPASTSDTQQAVVKLVDAGCSPAKLTLKAGRTTFKVINAGTSRISEMELLQGSRILGEKENLVPGLSGTFTLNLSPGHYTMSCPGGSSAATGVLTVGGTAVPAGSDADLAAATVGYKEFVAAHAITLVDRVKPFVAAVKAGDVAAAKKQFALARVPYETIEPVAESFGTLDPDIDARVNDVKPGEKWTGFHRIEKALWVDDTTKGMGPIADKLLADVKDLEARTEALTYQPDEIANGANGLLGEVATSKITGEEDRYSHTDLYDFEANVVGAKASVDLLGAALRARNPALAATIARQFAAVQAELATLKTGGGYPSYATVGDAERRRLSALITPLAASVAKISDSLGS
jgi:FTR1 family protein